MHWDGDEAFGCPSCGKTECVCWDREQQTKNWELIISHIGPRAMFRQRLTWEQQQEVWCLGDGYGDCTAEELARINSGWDWSHIRDSSPEARARMAEKIREILTTSPPST
jgi:hypothetical protein